ncbi:hypothetical protein KEM60_00922 [Austwickia sp. TVS 96-490-7B]|uniref:NUDIX hydrolase n=1 Tax=Austwickia sp. TVS 96-490-7B TaxID=2830843 RepID=UPI001C596CBD|nr:NUDIX domain-containing protein [Austwickia sp. TVS 96-490-7B]MBW3084733.1 hypothetical protein [Austwickia sp. TVS 96-490-7B]
MRAIAPVRTGIPTYPVLIEAVAGDTLVASAPLGHGHDPVDLLTRAGWRVERPLRAVRERGSIVVTFAVRSASPCAPPQVLFSDVPLVLPGDETVVPTDPELEVAPGERPVRRLRVSAAALVVAKVPVGTVDSTGVPGPGGECVLATRYSGVVVRWSGSWGLPGGGVDLREQPAQAARRETDEETGQDVTIGELGFVQSARWVGRAPDGTLEDFHALRLVYRGRCETPTAVEVRDLGGTTSESAWVPVERADRWDWAPGPMDQLRALGVLD